MLSNKKLRKLMQEVAEIKDPTLIDLQSDIEDLIIKDKEIDDKIKELKDKVDKIK